MGKPQICLYTIKYPYQVKRQKGNEVELRSNTATTTRTVLVSSLEEAQTVSTGSSQLLETVEVLSTESASGATTTPALLAPTTPAESTATIPVTATTTTTEVMTTDTTN